MVKVTDEKIERVMGRFRARLDRHVRVSRELKRQLKYVSVVVLGESVCCSWA
jgi:hypothetical protein